ncbi:MAG: hypothetical protein DMG30_27545 [Acidobacteria bacterium]|nr:MAG: hypothetical protein DMG30_27545 [Acidobacteriota bacterium]
MRRSAVLDDFHCDRPKEAGTGAGENVSKSLEIKLIEWRRGWDSNPIPVLKARKLLILRVALVAGTALTAVVGYSFGTDASHDPLRAWGSNLVEIDPQLFSSIYSVGRQKNGEPE